MTTPHRHAAVAALVSLLGLAAFAPAQWHPMAPLSSPPPRAFASMVFDPSRGETLLFSGGRLVAPFGAYQDTWTFDGSTWTQLAPAVSPPARPGGELVYDLWRGVVVLYGGTSASPIGGSSLSDTWEWNGVTWTQIATPTTAGARGRYGACFDFLRGRTVLYGGIASTLLLGALAGTWEYNGITWTQVATAQSPGPLQDPAMCFDAVRQRTVLFGGANPLTGSTDTTWTYDGTNWTVVPVTGPRPAARAQARLFWDALRNVCVLVGGSNDAGQLLDDTWTFDGTSWTRQFGLVVSARRAHATAFDTTRNVGVLFGGATGSGETWEYDGATYAPFGTGCAGSIGTPQLAAAAGPRLGQLFASTLTGLLPTMPIAAMATGFSNQVYNGIPLPVDLAPAGMPGCPLYTALDLIDVISAAGGTAVWTVVVPSGPQFLGLPFYQQGASLDPGVNAFGAVLSNAAAGVIGS